MERGAAEEWGIDAAAPPARLARMQLRIAPARIHFLKFILEGYDGLAVVSTLDPRQGLVELKYPRELQADLDALLASLGQGVGLACSAREE
jgi:hypothetical protein